MKRNKFILIIGVLISIFSLLLFYFVINCKPDSIENNFFGFKNFIHQNKNKVKKLNFILNDKNKVIDFNNKLDNDNYLPIYFSIKNSGKNIISPQIVINNKDWSSNKAIVDTAIKNSSIPISSDKEQLIRLTGYIYRNFRESYFTATPPYRNPNIQYGPIDYFNFFGYGNCTEYARILAILAETAGFKSRIVYFDKHVVTEIYYDNSWHMFDSNRNLYLVNKNNEIASVENIASDKSLLNQIKQKHNQEFYQNIFADFNILEIEYKDDFLNHKNKVLKYTLRPNEEIRFYYNWKESLFHKDSDIEPEKYSNGLLISPIDIKNHYQTISFQLPYPILDSYIYKKDLCKKSIKIFFSLDQKEWINIKDYCLNNSISLTDAFQREENATIINSYFLKIKSEKPTSDLYIYSQFQVAAKSIPKLRYGDNIIKFNNLKGEEIETSFVFKQVKN